MFEDYKVAYMKKHVAVREAQPLSFLRQSVGYVLSESARRIPHVAGINEMDVTPLVEYGRKMDRALAEEEDALSRKALFRRAIHRNFSAFINKAIAHSLTKVPCLNGFLDFSLCRNGGTFYRAADINLSFTVHTKYGVITPIIKNPHQKTLDDVASEMRDLARRARRTDPEELYVRCAKEYIKTAVRELAFWRLKDIWVLARYLAWPRTKRDASGRDTPENEKLQPEDILGSTITVANIGMMVPVIQTLTAIVPPAVAFIGIGDLHQAALVVDGKVVPRYVMKIMVTLDHRAFDAGEAFPLYDALVQYIQNPALIYDWKPGDPF